MRKSEHKCNECRRKTRDYEKENIGRCGVYTVKRAVSVLQLAEADICRMQLDGDASCSIALDRPVNRPLAKAAARVAWRHWIDTRAPTQWLDSYWANHQEPWLDGRLSNTEKYAMKYQICSGFRKREIQRSHAKKSARGGRFNAGLRLALLGAGSGGEGLSVVGVSPATLRQHFEQQFTEGMNWDRFASADIQIDHIRPVSQFDLSDDEQFKDCWSLTNLRPVWQHDNAVKGAKREYLI